MSNGANENQIVFDLSSDASEIAQQVIDSPNDFKALVELLGDENRRVRQFAAASIREVSIQNPELLVSYQEQLIDGLYRPEAQTRWELLEAISRISNINDDYVGKAFEAAEDALYDEDSGTLRLAAFHYFIHLGSFSKEWSKKVWPLIDESLQVYHGDTEFPEMLGAVYKFAKSDLDTSVSKGLIERLNFDATQGKGYIQKESQAIINELTDIAKEH
ncbi:MAG: hypothetical protein Q4E22_00860 [Coriobacteriia bacterium]|nr:hypothetical protein [Coriobacteriia bacterium]